MTAAFFGQFLLQGGIVDGETLLEALEIQRHRNRTLLELAVREGDLSEERARDLDFFYRNGTSRMEELLESIGGLDRDRVEQLQVMQRADWVRLGEALVQSGALSSAELERQLARYHETTHAHHEVLSERFQASPKPRLVQTVVRIAIEHLERLVEHPVKLVDLVTELELEPGAGGRLSSQHITGDSSFTVVLDLPAQLANAATSRLVGRSLEPSSEAETDALRELVNLVGGHVCTALEGAGIRLRPEPPGDTAPAIAADAAAVATAHISVGEQTARVTVVVE